MSHKKLVESIKGITNLCLKSYVKDHEVNRIATSDIKWTKIKSNGSRVVKNKRRVDRGDIYQIEFGKGVFPEIAYEHRGLVVGRTGALIYVLPIFSFNPNNPYHDNIYHRTDNPSGKKDLLLLKHSESDALKHDSVLKLNEIKTVSLNRLLYRQGVIHPSNPIYKDIEEIIFRNLFPKFNQQFNTLKENSISDKAEIERLKKLIADLSIES